MSIPSENELIEVVKEFHDTIRTVSPKLVLKTLMELRLNHTDPKLEDDLCRFIFREVCSSYSVELKKLKSGIYQQDDYQFAKKMSLILLAEHTTLTYKRIARFFNSSSHSIVSQAIKYKAELSTKIHHHKQFLDKYSILSSLIENYKNTTKQE